MTEKGYEKALAEIWRLMNTVPDTEEGACFDEGRRLCELAVMIGAYEDEHLERTGREERGDGKQHL